MSTNIPSPAGELATDSWREVNRKYGDYDSIKQINGWQNDERGVRIEILELENVWRTQILTENETGVYDCPVSRDSVSADEAVSQAEHFAENWEEYDYRA